MKENYNLQHLELFRYDQGGGGHDSNCAYYLSRVPMIHRFMTSHPVAELLLCFRAKHKDGRPMIFGFLVLTCECSGILGEAKWRIQCCQLYVAFSFEDLLLNGDF